MAQKTPSTARFAETRWSIVTHAGGQGETARRALEELCGMYWFPLYTWCRRNGSAPADAEDLVQSFFVKILEKNLFANADASRGKLRTFLLTALQRHVRDVWEREAALKRGGGQVVSFDAAEAEAWYTRQERPDESADHQYDRQWALTILELALRALEEDFAERGKQAQFAAMKPFLTREGVRAEYEAAGAAFGQSADSFKVAVHRFRAKFRDALRDEVAQTQADPAAGVEEEITYLARLLGSGDSPL
jgi:DNA-directed RNA polymerase specialized sigma24 family protein